MIWGGHRIECDVCAARGWVMRGKVGTTWPEPCGVCKGAASFSLYRLSRIIGCDPKTLGRVFELRAKPETAGAIFDKLTNLLATWSRRSGVR